MSSEVFQNRRDSNTTTVRVNLPYPEFQILHDCYEQSGEPQPDKRLGHNSAFKDWARMAVLYGDVEPSQFTVESVDWESDAHWPGDVVFTPEEISLMEEVSPEVERFRSNGHLAQAFRECLSEFLEGVQYE